MASGDNKNHFIVVVKDKLSKNPLVGVILFVFLLLSLAFGFLYLYYSGNAQESATGNFITRLFPKKTKSDCIYVISVSEKKFPLVIEADVEILSGDIISVKSPENCPNRFKFLAEIGNFRKPVSQVYTMSGGSPEDEVEIYESGYPNVTAYYIGDIESYKDDPQSAIISSQGPLPDLYESDKNYSGKGALLTFYRFNRIFFNGDNIYVNQVFFNEKY